MAKIKIDDLSKLIKRTLATKYNEEDSSLITDGIMFAELSGHNSHGVIRIYKGECSILSEEPKGRPEIISKTAVSSLVKGNGNPGLLVGSIACKEAIRIAKENGFGIVGTNETFSSSGSLSYYLEKIAKDNLIGMVMAQSLYSTAPYGGVEPMFGTNPIGFAIPTKDQPLIFDMATSAITFGDILKAQELGNQLPENVAIDKDGNPTTSPEEAIDGATLPFDNSYKGSGLAMMVEILAGIWPGASFAKYDNEKGWGNLFVVYQPDLLCEKAAFEQNVSKLIESVRNSKTKDGNKIRIPGENTLLKRGLCLKNGEVEIQDKILRELKNLQAVE